MSSSMTSTRLRSTSLIRLPREGLWAWTSLMEDPIVTMDETACRRLASSEQIGVADRVVQALTDALGRVGDHERHAHHRQILRLVRGGKSGALQRFRHPARRSGEPGLDAADGVAWH